MEDSKPAAVNDEDAEFVDGLDDEDAQFFEDMDFETDVLMPSTPSQGRQWSSSPVRLSDPSPVKMLIQNGNLEQYMRLGPKEKLDLLGVLERDAERQHSQAVFGEYSQVAAIALRSLSTQSLSGRGGRTPQTPSSRGGRTPQSSPSRPSGKTQVGPTCSARKRPTPPPAAASATTTSNKRANVPPAASNCRPPLAPGSKASSQGGNSAQPVHRGGPTPPGSTASQLYKTTSTAPSPSFVPSSTVALAPQPIVLLSALEFWMNHLKEKAPVAMLKWEEDLVSVKAVFEDSLHRISQMIAQSAGQDVSHMTEDELISFVRGYKDLALIQDEYPSYSLKCAEYTTMVTCIKALKALKELEALPKGFPEDVRIRITSLLQLTAADMSADGVLYDQVHEVLLAIGGDRDKFINAGTANEVFNPLRFHVVDLVLELDEEDSLEFSLYGTNNETRIAEIMPHVLALLASIAREHDASSCSLEINGNIKADDTIPSFPFRDLSDVCQPFGSKLSQIDLENWRFCPDTSFPITCGPSFGDTSPLIKFKNCVLEDPVGIFTLTAGAGYLPRRIKLSEGMELGYSELEQLFANGSLGYVRIEKVLLDGQAGLNEFISLLKATQMKSGTESDATNCIEIGDITTKEILQLETKLSQEMNRNNENQIDSLKGLIKGKEEEIAAALGPFGIPREVINAPLDESKIDSTSAEVRLTERDLSIWDKMREDVAHKVRCSICRTVLAENGVWLFENEECPNKCAPASNAQTTNASSQSGAVVVANGGASSGIAASSEPSTGVVANGDASSGTATRKCTFKAPSEAFGGDNGAPTFGTPSKAFGGDNSAPTFGTPSKAAGDHGSAPTFSFGTPSKASGGSGSAPTFSFGTPSKASGGHGSAPTRFFSAAAANVEGSSKGQDKSESTRGTSSARGTQTLTEGMRVTWSGNDQKVYIVVKQKAVKVEIQEEGEKLCKTKHVYPGSLTPYEE